MRYKRIVVQLSLRRRNRLMRSGQLLLAGKLSDKISHLIAAEKSTFLSSVNSRNAEELRSAVESAGGSCENNSILDLGPLLMIWLL
jgi:hypothetical protein